MRETQGFITEDGTFFLSELEAKLYEAEMRLRGALTTRFPNVNQEAFFSLLLTMMIELREYIDAHEAANPNVQGTGDTPESEIGESPAESEPPTTHDGQGFLTGTEEGIASLLKLPTRRFSDVSDVGSSTLTEKVSDGSSLDGA